LVTVIPTSAYSIKKVAHDIADVNGWNYYDRDITALLNDDAILVGNPDAEAYGKYSGLGRRVKVLYLVIEGFAERTWYIPLLRSSGAHVIAPSTFAANWLRKFGFNVEAVIPHGVAIPDFPTIDTLKKRYQNKQFLYIAGYLERKYPHFIGPMLDKLSHVNTRVISGGPNPYQHQFRKYTADAYQLTSVDPYYDESYFYMNLTSNEGYGITPLESFAHAVPVIEARLPPFEEFHLATYRKKYGDYPFAVDTLTDYWWNFGIWHIQCKYYDTDQYVHLVEKALSLNFDEYVDLAHKVYEVAKEYPLTVYKQFQKYF